MDELHNQILQYEAQLEQVQQAASNLPDGSEKTSLKGLEADLKEIIQLSKNNLRELQDETKNDTLADEYDLFKAELAALDNESEVKEGTSQSDVSNDEINNAASDNLKDELNTLMGSKCQAPFLYKWANNVSYHNAFISHIPELDQVTHFDDIKVKVMFTNPTHKEMLPCPYYLEGECKFNDEKCRYSHGESVSLSSLKDYREPIFSRLCSGCKILAKQDDGLWYRASVISVHDSSCNVKFESNSREENILFHNIFPLVSNEPDESSSSSDEENYSENDSNLEVSTNHSNSDLVKRILCNPPGTALGEWEKFTKGFGSKIMMKMGYVHGSGLGKDGAGRVEPVPAVILPAGKSLDHCMMLKEKAGNKDIFKAERKLKKFQKKHEEKLKKAYEAEKEKTDVFSFLNTKLDPKTKPAPNVNLDKQFKNETTRNLNVTCLQLAEEVKKLEKEVKSLKQSLSKHSPHSYSFNIIKEKLTSKESKLLSLQASEKRIRVEQDQRRDRQKLTVF